MIKQFRNYLLIFIIFSVAANINAVTGNAAHRSATMRTAAKSTSNSQASSESESSFHKIKSPDFAYPRNIIHCADSILSGSDKNKESVLILRQLIMRGLAWNCISPDSVTLTLSGFEDAAENLKAPYNSLAMLLEARTLVDVFNSNRTKYQQRIASENEISTNPFLWNEKIFEKKIFDLVKAANDADAKEMRMPLSEISSLLADYDAQQYKGLTVRDFIVSASVALLNNFRQNKDNIIPFAEAAESSEAADTLHECHDYILLIKSLKDKLIKDLSDYNATYGSPAAKLQSDIMMATNIINSDEAAEYLYDKMVSLNDIYFRSLLASYLYANYLRVPGSLKDDKNNLINKLYIFLEQLSDSEEFSIPSRLRSSDSLKAQSIVEEILQQMAQRSVSLSVEQISTSNENVCVKSEIVNMNNAYLLVYDVSTIDENTRITRNVLTTKARKVSCMNLTTDLQIPFSYNRIDSLPLLSPGRYVLVVSDLPELRKVSDDSNLQTATVRISDITMFTSLNGENNDNSVLYVVDAINGLPIKNCKVKFSSVEWIKGKRHVNEIYKISDENGCVPIPIKYGDASAEYKNSKCRISIASSPQVGKAGKKEYLSLFTSLGLYRPGDKVDFVAVGYSSENNYMHLSAGRKLLVEIYDPNSQCVADTVLMLDMAGRGVGQLTLPTDGLLGNFVMRGSMVDDNGKVLKNSVPQSVCFEVAEYKSPTFFVVVNPVEIKDDKIKIKGKVSTFSGLPVSNENVDIVINWRERWWRQSGNSQFAVSKTTDNNGDFEVILGITQQLIKDYGNGFFNVKAKATNAAGEVQESSPVNFYLSNSYTINVSGNSVFTCNEAKSAQLKVEVCDILNNPVEKEITYSVFRNNDNKPIYTGKFLAPDFELQEINAPGKYKLIFKLNSDTSNNQIGIFADSGNLEQSPTAEKEIVIYDPQATSAPFPALLWTPNDKIICDDNKYENVTVATDNEDRNILCIVSDNRGVKLRKWIVASGMIRLPIEVPADNERVYVNFITVKDNRFASSTITLLPADSKKKLKSEVITFRNKINAGSKEEWQIKYTLSDEVAKDVKAIAVMSDAALNIIAPFDWQFNPQNCLSWQMSVVNRFKEIYNNYTYYNFSSGLDYYNSKAPQQLTWQFWNHQLYGGNYYRGRDMVLAAGGVNSDKVFYSVAESSVKMSKAEAKSVTMESVDDDLAYDNGMSGISDLNQDLNANETDADEKDKLRDMQHPLSFFMPELISDENGIVELKFTTPDFNTKWNVQIVAYNNQLYSDKLTLQTTSSKPVMVETSIPYFARVGDEVEISATVYNNTDSTQSIRTFIELFDLFTGNVILRKEFEPVVLDYQQSHVCSMMWNVANNISQIGVRCKAVCEAGSDGEQGVMLILPSSSPVVESETFYLNPGEDKQVIQLPVFKDSSDVTLNVCSNPIWYCITALSPISYPESGNLSDLLSSLSANSIATGLVSRFPQIKSALEEWKSKIGNEKVDAVISPLLLNSEEKILPISATLFLQDAENESLRMAGIFSLLDSSYNKKTSEHIVAQISNLQNEDGGWSWCPGFKSSLFMTMDAVKQLAYLKNNHYIADPSLNKMLSKGVNYCDNEFVKDYRKTHGYSLQRIVEYLDMRQQSAVNVENKEFESLKEKVLTDLEKGWKKLDLYNKATAARVAYREGKKTLAENILVSLSQYATDVPQHGIFYDNISPGYSGLPKLVITSNVLCSFSLINPDNHQIIDGIRQWLVLQRQTSDWGSASSVTNIVASILQSGVNWAEEASAPEIFINGRRIDLPITDKYFGNYQLKLNSADCSGAELTILKSGKSPAWGGVISKYYAPVEDIKEASLPMLSIKKKLYIKQITKTGVKTILPPEDDRIIFLKKGTTITVTLEINSKQDMDYVAIKDGRSGTFTPVSQISGYEVNDNIIMYKESAYSSTNFFIDFLPKGVHEFSYDCYVTRDGLYSLGIATVQSQYSPLITAHSSGAIVRVSGNASNSR